MPPVDDKFLLQLLQACAERAPAPLYPKQYAEEQKLARDVVDEGFDELRRRGLIALTDWVKDLGQGRALTDAGAEALRRGKLTPAEAVVRAPAPAESFGAYERGEIVRQAILNPGRPYIAYTLLAVNIAVFLYGAFYAWNTGLGLSEYLLGDRDKFAKTGVVLRLLGGLCRPDVLGDFRRPEYERLITSLFLHLGILHLGMNMFFLGTLGGYVEAMWGHVRFLAIYFIAGIVGGCMVLLLGPPDPVEDPWVTIGASGCLCGVFTALVVWYSLNYPHLPEQALQDGSRLIFVNLMLLVGVNFIGGVSVEGHLGGAIGGLLAALFLQIQRFHSSRLVRVLALLATLAIPVGFFLAMLWHAGKL